MYYEHCSFLRSVRQLRNKYSTLIIFIQVTQMIHLKPKTMTKSNYPVVKNWLIVFKQNADC